MDNSIDLLQEQLKEKIKRLDKERAEKTAAFTEEQEKQRVLEEEVRVERIRMFKEAEERVLANRKAEAEREAERAKEVTEVRLRAEKVQNEQLELARQEEEKAERIRLEIANTEFAEEQHRKSLEQHRKSLELANVQKRHKDKWVASPLLNSPEDEEAINAHVQTGEAALGTEGLETGPELSPHMRSILRRNNSEVNR